MTMAESCFACENEGVQACTKCGRSFCVNHGDVGTTGVAVCETCLFEQKGGWKVILLLLAGVIVLAVFYSVLR
jgi:hypothetical protein